MKPLDVKTKFYNAESDEVFLEAQVAPKRFRCSIHRLRCILEILRLHIRDSPPPPIVNCQMMQVQNITQATITLDRVTLEPR